MMNDINQNYIDAGLGNWFQTEANIDAYIDSLIGGNGKASLAERISDTVVEVTDSASLTKVFESIITSKAIRCIE